METTKTTTNPSSKERLMTLIGCARKLSRIAAIASISGAIIGCTLMEFGKKFTKVLVEKHLSCAEREIYKSLNREVMECDKLMAYHKRYKTSSNMRRSCKAYNKTIKLYDRKQELLNQRRDIERQVRKRLPLV